MSDVSLTNKTIAATRGTDPRERVFLLGILGLVVGLVVAVFVSFTPLVRWLLLPLAFGSIGVMVGSLLLNRSAVVAPRIAAPKPKPQPQAQTAPKPAEVVAREPRVHQLPQAPVERKDLALGPNPWEAPKGRVPMAAIEPEIAAETTEPVAVTPVMDHSSLFEPPAASSPYLSHDAKRLVHPSDHELERARRAVARMVADLAPEPGAFDAVCERLIGVGDTMATAYSSLGRESADHEKILGIDLFDRLVETRVTGTGLDVMTWIRWVFAALHEDGGRDDDEFFTPMAVAMASRYGGTSERWLAAIAEPIRHVELGGVVQQLALAVKAGERKHYLLPDPDAVDRILEAPQWM